MTMIGRRKPIMPDQGLKPPVRPFEETFSAATVIKEAFFPHTLDDKDKRHIKHRDTRVWLRDAGDSEDQCWVPCAKGDPGAVEFRPV